MAGILTLLGFMGVIVSLVILLANAIRKKPNEKVPKIFWICFVVMVISFIMVPTSDEKEVAGNETKITKDDIKMFKKKYEDLSEDERVRLITIEKDMSDEEREKFKDDFKRLYVEEDLKFGTSEEDSLKFFEQDWDYNTRKRNGELTEEEKEREAAKHKPIRNIPYKIISKEDISFGAIKRYSWNIVVDDKANIEELKRLSKKIIENAKQEIKFNAIVLWFYDYEEYVGAGYTLGKAEYAPSGVWGKADTVTAGDYANMDYDFKLMEKDWEEQLTKEEVKIYKAWKDLYKVKDNGADLPDEDEISREIAEKFNISEDDVNTIILKQVSWQFNDKNKY